MIVENGGHRWRRTTVTGEQLASPPSALSDSRGTDSLAVGAPGASLRLSMLRAAAVPAAAIIALVAGAALYFTPPGPAVANIVWMVGLVITGLPVVVRTLRGMVRRQFAADIVASLAIVTAVALFQPFAGLVIVLMQSGGEALEHYAAGRASDAVRLLEEAAPRLAHRREKDGGLRDIPAMSVRVGDTLLVRPGELIPCDGVVIEGRSHVDTSRITGEPIPVSAHSGTVLSSGSANGEGPLLMRATALAGESQYARIVEMVRAAQASKAPIQRLADRYAIWFTPVTIAACIVAWLVSGDTTRILAVLVVATPCPLILAAPVAIIGGINRAARRQIIMRHGTALEQLARVTSAVFDKTGTLTIGRPRVRAVHPEPPFEANEVLRLAAAVEHGSSHLLARMVVEAAEDGGLAVPRADHVVEAAGRGVSGEVDRRHVAVGAFPFVAEHAPAMHHRHDERERVLQAYVAIDGEYAGSIEYADRLRPGLDEFIANLRQLGIARTILLSGDRDSNTRAVARAVGITEARGDLLPPDKVATVRALEGDGERVVMVGDGTNDAPALSAAAVGVAMASHGGGITAEAADVVLLADDVTLVGEAIEIAKRTMRVARQSIWVGLALSVVAMIVAAFGYIPPAGGALLQEGIDVAVILNALRASRA
jgi:heavy metal translocating P-type ATPase